MFQHIYRIFIAPSQEDEDTRNRELVLNILLFSSLVIMVLYLLLLLQSYLILHHSFIAPRILIAVGAMAFIGGLYRLSRGTYYRAAATLLVLVYFLGAAALCMHWGVLIPTGLLLFGLVIVLAGILVSSSFSLYAAAGVSLVLIGLQIGAESGVLHPDWSWTALPPTMGDIIGSCIMFGVLAVVSWLFNHQMERSLGRATRAEAALQKQKAALEDTVTERTRQLQAEQLERIQQMYRFAELGQLSTALLHDLANHLAGLTLDIEGLKGQKGGVMQSAKRSIRHLDNMVLRVRDQLRGKDNVRTFTTVTEVDEIVRMLRHKAQAADVLLKWSMPHDKKSLRTRGEPIRLRQMMANLISNGIDAYKEPGTSDEKREVAVEVKAAGNTLIITVDDWGRGIAEQDHEKLFEPFFSTKKTGMGMGLFIAKQIAAEHFHGSISIDASKPYTSFVIKLPRVRT